MHYYKIKLITNFSNLSFFSGVWLRSNSRRICRMQLGFYSWNMKWKANGCKSAKNCFIYIFSIYCKQSPIGIPHPILRTDPYTPCSVFTPFKSQPPTTPCRRGEGGCNRDIEISENFAKWNTQQIVTHKHSLLYTLP